MKKSIKVLSAIFAILLLSMTLTVPVTAVEYDVESRAVYRLGFEYMYVYENDDPENGDILMRGSAGLIYNSSNKTTYMNVEASLGDPDVFHDYGVQLTGRIDCQNPYNTQILGDSCFAEDIDDVVEVYISRVVTDDVRWIGTGNALYWGSSLGDVDAEVNFDGVEGVNFDY